VGLFWSELIERIVRVVLRVMVIHLVLILLASLTKFEGQRHRPHRAKG
jgi:hypothetical protein